MDICFQLIWLNTKEVVSWIILFLDNIWLKYVYFCKRLKNCFSKWMYHFTFPPGENECFCCWTSLSVFGIVSILNCSHSNRFVMISHCFNFQFPNDIQCLSSFHMLIVTCIYSSVRFR